VGGYDHAMSFFAVLFALLAEQLKPLSTLNPIHQGLTGWVRWVGRNFDAGADVHARVVWAVTVAAPAVLVGLLYLVLNRYSTVLALVVVLGALLLLLSRILTPLTNTARAIREMADGKRELGPLDIARKDEVGDLVLGFNRLVGRLREKEDSLKETEARLSFMAHHDALTGLLNRGILDDRLQQAVARAARNGTSFAVLFFDLDQFKPINDRWGHEVGDAVLVQVAKRLAQGRRRTDTVARFGGDEFIVLLIDLDDAHRNAGKIADEYLVTMRAPYRVGEHEFALTVSIGIAVYQGGPLTASHLLSQADVAMYRAKRAGSNAYCFYDELDNTQS